MAVAASHPFELLVLTACDISADWWVPPIQALQLADPHEMGYVVRWPLYGGHVNARDYPSHQVVLSDIEVILRDSLSESFSIDQKSYNVRVHLSLSPWGYRRGTYS